MINFEIGDCVQYSNKISKILDISFNYESGISIKRYIMSNGDIIRHLLHYLDKSAYYSEWNYSVDGVVVSIKNINPIDSSSIKFILNDG